jgi:predicted dehydrogenase
MPDHIETPLLLVGAGPMAVAYAQVLMALEIPFLTIGRGEESAARFEEKTGGSVIRGGLEEYLRTAAARPKRAIVAVGAEELARSAGLLIRENIEGILVEKPAGLTLEEIGRLAEAANHSDSDVRIGYNRRFFASVLKAREMIEEDGGVTSFVFEFTEWGHVVEPMPKAPGIKENWLLANSSHVLDLAFFLGGRPRRWSSYCEGSLPWHGKGAIFAGAGVSEFGAAFSYHANWAAPGRWGVEVLTSRRRLILRPLEKLQALMIGSVAIESVPIDEELDIRFKPGLFRQVRAFLERDPRLLGLSEHARNCETFARFLTTACHP